MARVTGITADTSKKLLLDAGAFFKNYQYGTDTPSTASAKLLGATVGGGSFSAVPTVRRVEVDGAMGPTKGFERIDSWEVTMVVNAREITAENIKLALGAADTKSNAIVGKSDIDDSDYIGNITWVGMLKGYTTPVVIVLENALSTNGFSIEFADKNEASVSITLTGHFAPGSEETPFKIYYPTT